jgi:hypothetical protein
MAKADKVNLTRDGVAGIWFDENTATKILQDLTEFDTLKVRKLPELETKIRLLELNVENYKLDLKMTEEIASKWEGQYKKSEEIRELEYKKFQEELAKKDKWYKSPAFMFVAGLIVGGALSVGIAFGIQGASK